MVGELIGSALGIVVTHPIREDIRETRTEKSDSELFNQKFLGSLMAIAGLVLLPVPGFVPAVVSTGALWTGVESWRSADKEQTIREAIARFNNLHQI